MNTLLYTYQIDENDNMKSYKIDDDIIKHYQTCKLEWTTWLGPIGTYVTMWAVDNKNYGFSVYF